MPENFDSIDVRISWIVLSNKLGCTKSKFPFTATQRRRRKRRKRHLDEIASLDAQLEEIMANKKANDEMSPPTFLFPGASSPQRISTGSAVAGVRNKVSLKPGRSLMDWIRLTHSGKDLTGVGGGKPEVTLEELAEHGKMDDAWICLKGLVYNITPYMEYHPGGFDELMRGAGRDATELFNEVHKWVNFESMLEKCLIGRLAVRPVALNKTNPSEETVQKRKFASSSMPKFDWFQSDKSLSLVVYTKRKELTLLDVTVDLSERLLRAAVRIEDMIFTLHLELEGEVLHPASVKIGQGSGCMEILLLKSNSSMWSQLGTTLRQDLVEHHQTEPYFRSCRLVKKEELTHDLYLFSLEPPSGTILGVPPGKHVTLSLQIQGVDVSRSYTPVDRSLGCSIEERELLHFMIKIYPDGAFTSMLHKLMLGDSIPVSDPMGTFEASNLVNYGRLALLAAGTGFTPMVKVINRFVTLKEKGRIWLMMFNKTIEDIPWRTELEKLTTKDKRFLVRHVLSEPRSDWQGLRGRIRAHLLERFLPRPVETSDSQLVDLEEEGDENCRMLICICGPTAFTKLANSLLVELGYPSKDLHMFTG